MRTLSKKQRGIYVGILIIVAYSMLTYTITKNPLFGVFTDLASGLAVIGIPVLLYPYFKSDEYKTSNYAYIISRFIEGALMIVGGTFILIPDLEPYREFIYSDIHIYFFISGALFFYILLYKTQIIPKYISIWGIVATSLLLLVTIIKLFDIDLPILNALVIPIVLNEFYLAGWLIFKGFKFPLSNKI